jgi:hypothetical protein
MGKEAARERLMLDMTFTIFPTFGPLYGFLVSDFESTVGATLV